MFKTAAFSIVIAVGVLAFYTSLKAADAPAATAGVITGKVVDDAGAAVADAKVNLTKPREAGATGRPETLATATTDKDGKFELKFEAAKVPDGTYNLGCRTTDKNGRTEVKIKDGKIDPAGDVTITVKARPAKTN